MTQVQGPVRAVARVGGAAPTSPGPVRLARARRPGHLGAISVAQLLVLETVFVVVLAVAGVSRPVLIGGAGLLLVVLLLLFGRRHGRRWSERFVMAWRFRQRRGFVPDQDNDRRLATLHQLVPDLTVSTYEPSDGERVGIAHDDAGWFAIAAVANPTGMRGDTFVRLPFDRLSQALREMDQPGSVVQVIMHTVPAPTTEIDPRNRCVTSYRELMETHGSVPADRSLWIAVRLDEQAFVRNRVDDIDPMEHAPAVVTALIRRMGRVLRRDGMSYQVLDADATLDVLVRSLDLDQPPTGGHEPGEAWDQWRSARLSQVSFWVRDWPAPDQAAPMLERLASAPAAQTSVAVMLDARDEDTDLRCIVRVASHPYALAASVAGVSEIAERSGGRLLRLDGEHAPAAYASAPTGGGPR